MLPTRQALQPLLLAAIIVLAALEGIWLLSGQPSSLLISSVTFVVGFLAAVMLANVVTYFGNLESERESLSTALRESAEQMAKELHLLQGVLDHVPDRIYVKDRQSRFLRINRALAERFGLSDPAQIAGKSDADFFSAIFARQTRADEEEVMESGKPLFGKEEKETWPDGRETWAVTTTLPYRDRQGNIIG